MKSVGDDGSKAKLESDGDEEGELEEEEEEKEGTAPSSCARRIAVEIGDGERRSQGSKAYPGVTIRSGFEPEEKEEGAEEGGSPTLAASSGADEMASAFFETTSGRSSSTKRDGAFLAACSLKKRVSDPAPKLMIWERGEEEDEEGGPELATRERNAETRPEMAAWRQKYPEGVFLSCFCFPFL